MQPSTTAYRSGLLASLFTLIYFALSQFGTLFSGFHSLLLRAQSAFLFLAILAAVSCLIPATVNFVRNRENDRKVDAEMRKYFSTVETFRKPSL
ncbi:MAG: hypothetical protein JWM04_913 [Verrucomicrobiales bacterium]|nr:hypothetical protein [Verrucomicrobiales bacterium]